MIIPHHRNEFLVGYPDWYTPGKSRRAQWPKRCDINHKDEDNSPDVDIVNNTTSFQKFRLKLNENVRLGEITKIVFFFVIFFSLLQHTNKKKNLDCVTCGWPQNWTLNWFLRISLTCFFLSSILIVCFVRISWFLNLFLLVILFFLM